MLEMKLCKEPNERKKEMQKETSLKKRGKSFRNGGFHYKINTHE